MAENTFEEGFARLREHVGLGELTGELVVDQHYALDQHENFNYEHPRGGGPKYLINPLLEHVPIYLERLIQAIDQEEQSLVEAMIENMEHLSTLLDPAAPIDKDPNPIRLRRSGQPIVWDNGKEVYHRPPVDPREPMGPEDEDRYDADGFRLDQDY